MNEYNYPPEVKQVLNRLTSLKDGLGMSPLVASPKEWAYWEILYDITWRFKSIYLYGHD